MKVLCVAEKPSIAKAVAGILSGNRYRARDGKNKYCKNFDFEWQLAGRGPCEMTMTSVMGHLMELDFTEQFSKWQSCSPAQLFHAPIVQRVPDDKKSVAANLKAEARHARVLIIWTDCDREGESIGSEIVQICSESNPRLEVLRARFSVVQRGEIVHAINNLVPLDMKLADAVRARSELDLRVGSAFTRFQTLRFQNAFPELQEKIISYGSCQFPTLGFVVEQYWKRENFISEPFWCINLVLSKDNLDAGFTWSRGVLYDRMCCFIFYHQCLMDSTATITSVQSQETKKWRPLPLTTVELQKFASRYLKISSDRVMAVAESLYNKGIISYPRTETDQFDQNFNLQPLIEEQTRHPEWGSFAQRLQNGGFRWPRKGKNNDKAHPPIHPTKMVADLQGDDKKVYEFITRRFLACCSEDAIGFQTMVTCMMGGERFKSSGLQILAKNYLEVYHYDKWSDQPMPIFQQGEVVQPKSITMTEGKTTAPSLLTEADLIATMDKNGIGTDATIAEHIKKIQERNYAIKQGNVFVPSTLGLALVEGYDDIGFANSLAKPVLRREMEQNMKDICFGMKNKETVIQQGVEMYEEMFSKANNEAMKLQQVMEKFFGRQAVPVGTLNARSADRSFSNRSENETANSSAMSQYVGKCRRCNADMVLRTKRDGGYFVGCQGYPGCSNAIWLPNTITNAKVTTSICMNCSTASSQTLKLTITSSTPVSTQTVCVFPGCGQGGGPLSNSGNDRPPGPHNNTSSFYDTMNSFTLTRSDSDKPRCPCDYLAKLITVSKDGPNKGRLFYACSKTSGKCQFFQWADEEPASDRAPRRTLSNDAPSDAVCFSCNRSGHYASSCPSRNNPGPSSAQRSEVTCYRCNQSGHVSTNCPEGSKKTRKVTTSRAKSRTTTRKRKD